MIVCGVGSLPADSAITADDRRRSADLKHVHPGSDSRPRTVSRAFPDGGLDHGPHAVPHLHLPRPCRLRTASRASLDGVGVANNDGVASTRRRRRPPPTHQAHLRPTHPPWPGHAHLVHAQAVPLEGDGEGAKTCCRSASESAQSLPTWTTGSKRRCVPRRRSHSGPAGWDVGFNTTTLAEQCTRRRQATGCTPASAALGRLHPNPRRWVRPR